MITKMLKRNFIEGSVAEYAFVTKSWNFVTELLNKF